MYSLLFPAEIPVDPFQYRVPFKPLIHALWLNLPWFNWFQLQQQRQQNETCLCLASPPFTSALPGQPGSPEQRHVSAAGLWHPARWCGRQALVCSRTRTAWGSAARKGLWETAEGNSALKGFNKVFAGFRIVRKLVESFFEKRGKRELRILWVMNCWVKNRLISFSPMPSQGKQDLHQRVLV